MTSETIAPGAGASDLRETARDASVIWLGLFALGIGFGVVVTSHGLPWWLALGFPSYRGDIALRRNGGGRDAAEVRCGL